MSSKTQIVSTADVVFLPTPNYLLKAPHSIHVQDCGQDVPQIQTHPTLPFPLHLTVPIQLLKAKI